MLNTLILQLISIIKKIINNPINVLTNAARSPDKKIKIVHKKIVKKLIFVKLEFFLKYKDNPIIKKSTLDK